MRDPVPAKLFLATTCLHHDFMTSQDAAMLWWGPSHALTLS